MQNEKYNLPLFEARKKKQASKNEKEE